MPRRRRLRKRAPISKAPAPASASEPGPVTGGSALDFLSSFDVSVAGPPPKPEKDEKDEEERGEGDTHDAADSDGTITQNVAAVRNDGDTTEASPPAPPETGPGGPYFFREPEAENETIDEVTQQKMALADEHAAELKATLDAYLVSNAGAEASKVKDIMVPAFDMTFAGKVLLCDAPLKLSQGRRYGLVSGIAWSWEARQRHAKRV